MSVVSVKVGFKLIIVNIDVAYEIVIVEEPSIIS